MAHHTQVWDKSPWSDDALLQETKERKELNLKPETSDLVMKYFQLTVNVFCANPFCFFYLFIALREDEFPFDFRKNWLALGINVFSLVLLYLLKINICDIARTLICAKSSLFTLMHVVLFRSFLSCFWFFLLSGSRPHFSPWALSLLFPSTNIM